MKEILALIGIVLGTIAAVIFVLAYSVAWIDVGYQERQCSRFGEVSGREVQFRQFSHWSYDCYVRAGDGKWILRDQLRDVAS